MVKDVLHIYHGDWNHDSDENGYAAGYFLTERRAGMFCCGFHSMSRTVIVEQHYWGSLSTLAY